MLKLKSRDYSVSLTLNTIDTLKDTVKNQIRCVVGIQKNYILVAFEAGLEPRVMPVGEEGFERGYFVVA